VAFALTVSIDVMLVPMHGGVGAAIGMLTAQTVGGLTAAILFTRAMNSSLRELMPRTGDLGWLLRKVRAVASRPAEQGAG
jgi:Na+-driven multidrug efflux pump